MHAPCPINTLQRVSVFAETMREVIVELSMIETINICKALQEIRSKALYVAAPDSSLTVASNES